MQAVHDWLPPSRQARGDRPFDLVHQPRSSNRNLPARLNKTRQVAQIQIIGSVVWEGIYRNDGIKEVVSEWKRPGVGMNRVHPVFNTGISNSLKAFRGAEPQVYGPNLDFEFMAQEYG